MLIIKTNQKLIIGNDFKEKFSKYDKVFKSIYYCINRLELKVISNYVHSIKRKV